MLKFNDKGLIPVIVQDADNGEVLMLGYADKEALRRTLDSGEVWFYSRSRQELWHKGATSGSILKVKSIAKDCDSDAILIRAEPGGPVCHTGNQSCFFQTLDKKDVD
jgi:phosphoribosyl-ATP pyrophosphohydrolase/phosphoribosyl-AMP cyclohydrolase